MNNERRTFLTLCATLAAIWWQMWAALRQVHASARSDPQGQEPPRFQPPTLEQISQQAHIELQVLTNCQVIYYCAATQQEQHGWCAQVIFSDRTPFFYPDLAADFSRFRFWIYGLALSSVGNTLRYPWPHGDSYTFITPTRTVTFSDCRQKEVFTDKLIIGFLVNIDGQQQSMSWLNALERDADTFAELPPEQDAGWMAHLPERAQRIELVECDAHPSQRVVSWPEDVD
jgi:hypothetical protein